MRKFLAVLVAVLVVLTAASALATPAHAAWISYDYCDSSLRGYTNQAPDNDIRRTWNEFQAMGHNITSTRVVDTSRSDNNTYMNYAFRANGYDLVARYRCYWSGGVYHDVRY